ncbi:MAG: peptide chain release factor N(5)-glutamine methyltransferase [Deltaproteobacteria bacterium]
MSESPPGGAAPPPPERSADAPWTIQRLLAWTAKRFEALGLDGPRLTAEVLLAHALGKTRLQLYLSFDQPLQADELSRFRELVRQRSERVPTQHLVGGRELHGHWFRCDGRALVPRPETEQLIDACLHEIPGDGGGVIALDLCAGTGCVGLSLLAERPALRVVAVELSVEAVALARDNAQALGLAARYELRTGDLFAPIEPGERFAIIAANPPYVPTPELATLSPEVRDHDPRLALDGGPDGLSLIRRIAALGPGLLLTGGLLALEIGDGQGSPVRALLEGAGLSRVRVERDLARQDRLALGWR